MIVVTHKTVSTITAGTGHVILIMTALVLSRRNKICQCQFAMSLSVVVHNI